MAIVNTHYGFCAKGGAMPKFTYTGEYNVRDDGVVELLTSGTITFLNPAIIDIFCVGGGGSGGNVSTSDYSAQIAAGGGGGGYCKTAKKISVSGSYAITVGAGGLNTQNSVYQGKKQYGGTSSFGSLVSAGGGMSAYYGFVGGQNGYSRGAGGDGGSGGGSPSTGSESTLGPGGYDGADGGKGTKNVPGRGAGTTTREFGELKGKLYAGGGGGGLSTFSDTTIYSQGGQGGGGHGGWVGKNESLSIAPENGKANTGGGGGGMAGYKVSPQKTYYSGGDYRGGNGGSGIVCFRVAK